MTVVAARDCAVYAGGAPVTMTGEACSDVSGGARTSYQVTASTKQVLDPETAITVYDNASPVTSTDYAVDYATATVTFSVARTGGHTITLDAKYIPLLQLAYSRSARVARPQGVFADATRLQDTTTRMALIGKRCSITLEHMTSATEDLGGTTYLDSLISDGRLFVRATLGDGKTLNGWFATASAANHDMAAVLSHTLTLTGIVQTCVGRPGTDQALFSLS
jgi:hypothetical protein